MNVRDADGTENAKDSLISRRSIMICFSWMPVKESGRFGRFFLIMMLSIFPACTEKMTVHEAKEAALTTGGRQTYTPPPRGIQDILAAMEEKGSQPKDLKDHESAGDMPLPKGADPAQRMQYHSKKGYLAWENGREEQALEDLRKAYRYAIQCGAQDEKLFVRLAKAERAFGNFSRAIELVEKAHAITNSLSMFDELIFVYGGIGDVDKAKKAHQEALQRFMSRRKSAPPGALLHVAQMSATILEMEGKWKEAEEHVRKSVEILNSNPSATPVQKINARLRLCRNLTRQERFLEAEFENRNVLKEALQYFGNSSNFTLKTLNSLITVTLAQGRTRDAEKLAKLQVSLIESAHGDHASGLSFKTRARMSLADVLAAKGEFTEAMVQFDMAEKYQEKRNRLESRKYAGRLSMMLSLVMVGRTDEALKWTAGALEVFRPRFGDTHPLTAEVSSIQGLAKALLGKKKEALETMGKAVPVMIEAVSGEGRAFSRIQRLKVILEGYLALLAEVYGTDVEKELGIDAAAEGFRIADAARGSSVHTALAAGSARAAVTDPTLAESIRREQDSENQIAALQETLVDMLAASKDEQTPVLISDLQGRIETMVKAKTVLLVEIKARFPKYSTFVRPELPTPDQIQGRLHSDEALISIYTSTDRTYLWAFRNKGRAAFAVSGLGRKDLSERVAHLREALDPRASKLGDLPAFDVGAAYELYKRILNPVESGWKGARDLVVIAGGSLGQLPLSLLPSGPHSNSAPDDVLFDSYRKVPWLIRSASITRLPSASSFLNLRTLPDGNPGRKTFMGFGDPVFNLSQIARAEMGQVEPAGTIEARGKPLFVRGIRTTGDTDLDRGNPSSSGIENLNRLPDTAVEIRAICGTLGADPSRDIFLGKEASEQKVKSLNLSPYRVIAFATHALVAGDLDGLDQPALALSSPAVTGDKEDGLLTMGEVLRLNLNADWVVLSACNTGAAEGEGAEAVSGLGKAFFYAGTRALLVSMWPVETTSARLLTTGVFRYQKEQTGSRSKALQSSILELMDHHFLMDREGGKIVASYCHPFFWAPFIVVGEAYGNF